MGNRLWLCLIVLSILVVCPRKVQAGIASSAVYENLEEATLYAVSSTSSNYFVPIQVQTAGSPRNISNELIVLYDFAKSGITPDEIVAAVNGVEANAGLVAQLGTPDKSRFMIRSRLSTEERASLDANNPRYILQNYVVLKYPESMSFVALNNIVERLKKNPLVRWVEHNSPLSFSVIPSDPLYTGSVSPPGPAEHQWGMDMLNLPSAWDMGKGSAYIAALDNGIQLTHPDLQSNFRPQFSRDFSNCNPDFGVPCLDDDIDELKDVVGTVAGHGTHVAGIMAASTNNLDSGNPSNYTGVAGTCWNCSLMMGKVGENYVNSQKLHLKDSVLNGMVWLVGNGAQAINLSTNDYYNALDCSSTPDNSWCHAIRYAAHHDVVLVNSSGNGGYCKLIGDQLPECCISTASACNGIDQVLPPGSDNRVISVGAVNHQGAYANFSDFGTNLDLVSPGVDVLSTYYTGASAWNPKWNCQDTMGGYGICTGTSMSAPHVTGIVGLLRSANPLLSRSNIESILKSNASLSQAPTAQKGYGIPDASKAVAAALGKVQGWHLSHPPSVADTLPNRLTPLFSMYSDAAEDHFYTIVPQMALAAFYGTLQPQPPSPDGPVYYAYDSMGTATPGYSGVPCSSLDWCPPAPKASVYIFTTENTPIAGTPSLVPLYRLSYQGNFTGNNPSHVDHAYTTEQTGIDYLKGRGYKLDGIEGYIFNRNTTPQPPGTVRLFRKESLLTGDHAIFPETEIGQYDPLEWVDDGNEWIGYVYPNIDTDGDHLIDGFERLIGSCVGVSDTNGDGHLDGTFVSEYPYRDPGLCHYISVSPSPLLTYHFGSVAVGYSTSATFTVFHGGSVIQEPDLNIAVASTDAHFVVSNDTCSIPSGGVCSFSVQFNPSEYASNYATLTITSNDPFEPSIPIHIDGTGVPPPQLTVTKAGAGTVYSAPGAINCGPTCSGPFAYNALVSLTAIPDIGGSIFTGWSGECNGSGQVTMGGNKACTATFASCTGGPAAKVGSSTYGTIWDAYNNTPPGTFDIEIIASNQGETLNFNKASTVTLKGGRDCAFGQQTPPAVTFLTGSFTLTNGSVIFDGIAIR